VKRFILGTLVVFWLVVAGGARVASQTGYQFEPETKALLVRMIQKEPGACVDLVEQAESLAGLREALIERVRTKYRAAKIVEAARALRDLGLSEDMTLREIKEAADAIAEEGGGQ
jgi:hypothetical protein